ncbi:putative transposase [Desulfomicrobium macestii]|uniref:Transposase n=2 Tax=Desulfomicrobium macestii TaxID=90731 RepID=A0ABR9H8Q9_9BACT|nr:putative transposase [Desulfomicrobium macestii]
MHVHLVFVTKYRRRVFEARHIKYMRGLFARLCSELDAEMVEMDGEEDHVHILVNYPPKLAVSTLVNALKGTSSRRLRGEFPEIERRYYKGVLWSPSYFAGSCGGAPLTVIRQYVENQQTPG